MSQNQTTPAVTCFMAAICRDLDEGGDGYRYFGSLGAWTGHQRAAMAAGLLTADGALTEAGRRVGAACRTLPGGRAYFWSEQYERAAKEALNVSDDARQQTTCVAFRDAAINLLKAVLAYERANTELRRADASGVQPRMQRAGNRHYLAECRMFSAANDLNRAGL